MAIWQRTSRNYMASNFVSFADIILYFPAVYSYMIH